MKIFGQDKLINIFNSYSLSTLPKTIMLIGEIGSGKKTLLKYLADRLGLAIKLVDENVDSDTILEYSMNPIKTLYVINLTDFTEKQQNQFLKFIEEPVDSVYIAITVTSEVGVLPTITNRCKKYYLESYTPEILRLNMANEIQVTNDHMFDICKTPGQLKAYAGYNFDQLYEFCSNIVLKVHLAAFENFLKLALKINIKEFYDLFDFNLFLDTLEYVSFDFYKKNLSQNAWIIYTTVNKYKQILLISKVYKDSILMSLFTEIWEATHNEAR